MAAILRPPTLLDRADPEVANYAVEIHNAILQLDRAQQDSVDLLNRLQKTLSTAAPAPAPSPVTPTPPSGGGSVGAVGKYAGRGPSAPTKFWFVTHGLGTPDVLVQIRNLANDFVSVPVQVIDANTIVVKSSSTMGANQFFVVVHG